MAQCMKDIGEMIYSMELVKKVGQMDPFMKENMLQERSMVLAFTVGMMDQSIKENGMRIRLKDSEHTAG